MPVIMKGSEVAEGMKPVLLSELEALKARGISPALGVVRVGARPDDLAYERGIMKRFASLGLGVKVYELPENISQQDFNAEFIDINDNQAIHGILLFRPLPEGLNDEYARYIIYPRKDVDCMSLENEAGVFSGDSDSFVPCTASGIMAMLSHYGYDLEGRNVAIIGRSMVVGRPLAMLMLGANATVTICHTKTRNLPEICRRSDVIIAAAGRARMITAEYLNEHSIVVDAGINIDAEGKLCGDVDYENVTPIVQAISPVPGGVGAVTTSILARNVIRSAKMLA